MKGISVILVLLTVGMLVFGCTYSTQNTVNYSTGGSNETAGAPSSGGTQNPSGGASGTTQPSGTSSGGSNPPTGAGGPGAGTSAPAEPVLDLPGENYSSLIGSGAASSCTLSYSDESKGATVLNLFFDGKGAMRIEQHDTGNSACPYALMIFKGDSSGNGMLYLSCPGHNEEALGQKFATHEQCEWQSMDISSDYGGIGSSSLGLGDGYSTPSLDYVKEPVYSCRQWTLDSSKFDTGGFVCD